VIKIGTSSLINEKYGTLNLSSLSKICEVVRELHAKGEEAEATDVHGVVHGFGRQHRL
jgi:glutamate 5-kinase